TIAARGNLFNFHSLHTPLKGSVSIIAESGARFKIIIWAAERSEDWKRRLGHSARLQRLRLQRCLLHFPRKEETESLYIISTSPASFGTSVRFAVREARIAVLYLKTGWLFACTFPFWMCFGMDLA